MTGQPSEPLSAADFKNASDGERILAYQRLVARVEELQRENERLREQVADWKRQAEVNAAAALASSPAEGTEE